MSKIKTLDASSDAYVFKKVDNQLGSVDYSKKPFQIEEVKQIEDDLFQLDLKYKRTTIPIYFRRKTYDFWNRGSYRIGLYGDKCFVTMEERQRHEPAYLGVAMDYGLIDIIPMKKSQKNLDNHKNNQYMKYVGIFLDGNQYNLIPENIIIYKLTDEEYNHICLINDKFKKLDIYGSVYEVDSYINSIINEKLDLPKTYFMLSMFYDIKKKQIKDGVNTRSVKYEGKIVNKKRA